MSLCEPRLFAYSLLAAVIPAGLCLTAHSARYVARPCLARQSQRLEFVSNRGMEYPNNIEQRLTDLEIKASFTEDMVDQLNQVIVRQQQQLDMLIREIGQLQQQSPGGEVGVMSRLRDELPPHY